MSTPSPDKHTSLLQLQALPPNAILTDAKPQAELITLLQSPDPLTSHIATSLLLAALRQTEPGFVPDKTWLAKLFTFPPITPRFRPNSNKRQKKALTNTLEAARRVIEALYSSTVDPELRPLQHQQQHQEGNTSNDDTHVRGYLRTAIAEDALLVLMKEVLQCYDLRWLWGIEEEGHKEEEEAELPVVWLFKLGRVLRRAYQEDEEENKAVYEAVEWRLLQMCHTHYQATRGGVESRREALQLALEILNDLQVEETEGKRIVAIVKMLTSLCSYEYNGKEGEDDGAVSSSSSSCSLVRKPQLSDLWPHRLYLWSRLTKLVVEGKEWLEADWMARGTLERQLISECFVCGVHFLDGEKGRRLLMERLVDHDDILMGVLNNLLVIHCIQFAAFDAGNRFCSPEHPLFLFVPGTEPQLLLATFLELLPEGSAEQVFLDYLISNETCALEYLLRLTKYIVACQDRQEQGEREGEGGGAGSTTTTTTSTTTTSSTRTTIPSPSPSASAAVTEFLLSLGQRLQGMRLFPYDVTPLLTRIQQLQR